MLARISGTLESLEANTALIAPAPPTGHHAHTAPSGLAYEVLLPAYLADRLLAAHALGGPITLHTLQYLESQNQGASFIPRLLGFASPRERQFFELLTSVKGLGNKRAMRAMALEPHTIARAIADRDARFLQTLPEIGPKLAELIVHELKSKVDRHTLGAEDLTGLNTAAANQPAAPAPPTVEPKPDAPKGRPRKAVPASLAHLSTPSPPPRAPMPPIRQTVNALVALGESPLDAERMVARAIDRARSANEPLPTTPDELLTAAYAAR